MNFYVGQMVRVNMPASTVHGRETVILDLFVGVGRYVGHRVDLLVEVGYGAGEMRCVFEPHELEPILDPGREVISWSAMEGLWVPGGVVA